MSERLDHVDQLILLCRTTLADLRAGNLPDLETFSVKFDETFAALEVIDARDGVPDDSTSLRRRLRELDRIRTELAEELAVMHSEMGDKLTQMNTGKKGIDAYRSTLGEKQRGNRRGQG